MRGSRARTAPQVGPSSCWLRALGAPARALVRYRVLLVAWYGVAQLCGLVLWLTREPAIETPEYPADPLPSVRANLASPSYGTRVRVSSWDWQQNTHPYFAIDGAEVPSKREKWQSAGDDSAPWLEVIFAGPVRVEEVALSLAGVAEDHRRSMARYVLRCLPAGRASVSTAKSAAVVQLVENNQERRPRHPLLCERASGVRIDFELNSPGRSLDRARVYEVEVYGTAAHGAPHEIGEAEAVLEAGDRQ